MEFNQIFVGNGCAADLTLAIANEIPVNSGTHTHTFFETPQTSFAQNHTFTI